MANTYFPPTQEELDQWVLEFNLLNDMKMPRQVLGDRKHTDFVRFHQSGDDMPGSRKWSMYIEARGEPIIFPKSLADRVNDLRIWGPMEQLDPSIRNFRNVTFINMVEGNLCELPEEFAELKKLKILALVENKFSKFPVVLSKLPNLVEIELSYNPIRSLDPCLKEMVQLRSLSLAKTGINSIWEHKVLLYLWKNQHKQKLPTCTYSIGKINISYDPLVDSLDI